MTATGPPGPTGDARPYALAHVQRLLGLSRRALAALIEAGFVNPTRGPRRELRFSFQEVMLLRTARALQLARIPPRKIVRSLAHLRSHLPQGATLTSVRISAVGGAVAAHDAAGRWEAESGQRLMDFDHVAADACAVAVLPARQGFDQAQRAREAFAQGALLESSHAAAAQAAYRLAIALAPADPDATLNLGAMLCDAGRADEAIALYDDALAHGADSPLIHFNRAIALEDGGRLADALASYARCLRADPAFADAHFNCARLHERLGDSRAALRHFNAYRRLVQ